MSGREPKSPSYQSLEKRTILKLKTTHGVKAIGYTDDIVILVRGPYEEVLQNILQQALDKMIAWCTENGLSIQPEKVGILVFTRKYKVKPLRKMRIGNRQVEYSTEMKYLEIIRDNTLRWNKHLEITWRKAIVTF